MDCISLLPNDLLLKILSLIPTKDVVATMILSKRWKPLWMSIPQLEYIDDTDHNTEYNRFQRFVQCSLSLHTAPVIKSLCFTVGPDCNPLDIWAWVKHALTRPFLHKLEINFPYCKDRFFVLPKSLYTCRTLKSLHLSAAAYIDVPDQASLPSLKALFLIGVTYSGNESVHKLLSGCPILESLDVERFGSDNVTTFTVKVPSLLTLDIYRESDEELQSNDHGILIDAPSLTSLNIKDDCGRSCLIKNTPMLKEADVDVIYNNSDTLMASLTSVERLRLCFFIPRQHAYPKGINFHRLQNLQLCTCTRDWLNLLMSLLHASPRLQVLKLKLNHEARTYRPAWNQPSCVPECVSSNLETFEWRSYKGTQEEKELVKFILRNGQRLKTLILPVGDHNLDVV